MTDRWTIEAAGYTATVLRAGGGLWSLTHQGRDLLGGPGSTTPVTGGRGQLLMPWPNRIRDGRYSFDGVERQLSISEPAFHNASHGLVRWTAWQPAEVSADRVRLGCLLVPQPGFPWELDLAATYALDDGGLSVELSAHNRSASAVPFAAGMHPYLYAGTPVDDATLTLAAGRHLRTDDRHLPAGLEPTPAERDFAAGRRIGDLVLDDAWTDLARDTDGRAVIRLEAEHAVELCLDAAWRWAQAFTGDTLAVGARQALAVEPMTAPPDAFNSGTDLVVLDPDESWAGSFVVRAG